MYVENLAQVHSSRTPPSGTHLERYRDSHPDLIELILDSFYVDDLTTGADSEEEAHSVYVESPTEGGFNL